MAYFDDPKNREWWERELEILEIEREKRLATRKKEDKEEMEPELEEELAPDEAIVTHEPEPVVESPEPEKPMPEKPMPEKPLPEKPMPKKPKPAPKTEPLERPVREEIAFEELEADAIRPPAMKKGRVEAVTDSYKRELISFEQLEQDATARSKRGKTASAVSERRKAAVMS